MAEKVSEKEVEAAARAIYDAVRYFNDDLFFSLPTAAQSYYGIVAKEALEAAARVRAEQ